MQTLKITIADNFLQDFLSIVEHYKGKIKIEKDENLLQDPFFYERQKQLQEDLRSIDDERTKLYSQEEYTKKRDDFLKVLRTKYAD